MSLLVLRHARALSSGPVPPGLAVVTVEDGHVAAVDPEDPSRAFPPDARVLDLGGRLLTPAFVDAHVHLAMTGLQALGVDLAPARSAGEALELLAMHARTTALGVVLGHGWDETRWAGEATFRRSELDEAVGGRPAYVSRVDLHSAFASSALLDAARTHHGVDAADHDGWSAEGPLSRGAHHVARDTVTSLLSADDRAAAIRHALQVAAARGLGQVHELGAPHICDAGDLATAARLGAEAARGGAALPEVVGYWGETEALDRVRDLGCQGAAGDICMDGAIGSRTAALKQPYADDPSTRGHLYLSAADVADHVVACTRAGLQAGFHVIGDHAVAELATGLRLAADKVGEEAVRSAGHRLEHVEMPGPDEIALLARLGVTASVQPVFDRWWGGEDGLYAKRLGERRRGMNPLASLRDAGVPLAFGSDSPVTPFDPWAAVRAAVHHHDAAERLDVLTAFDAHTRGGWRAARRDGGTLEPGAPASLAVWDVPAWAEAQRPDGSPVPVPRLDPETPLPTCVLTLVHGAVAYDGGVL